MKGTEKFFIISFFVLAAFNSNAQQVDSTTLAGKDVVPAAQHGKKSKVFNHYIGLQANQLFKQFLNLDAANTVVKNPYLLTYTVSYSRLHLGIQGGFGYTYDLSKDKLSPTALQTTLNNVSYRGGIFRSYALGKKWEAFTGVNYVGNYKLNRTVAFSVVHSNNTITDSTYSVSTSVSKRKGAELQLSLGFHISGHIMLFTEASLHYFIERDRSNVLVSQTVTHTDFPENDTFTLSSSNSDTEDVRFGIIEPLALFLTIKF